MDNAITTGDPTSTLQQDTEPKATAGPAAEEESLSVTALHRLHNTIRKSVTMNSLIPSLNEENLLTVDDLAILRLSSTTEFEKVDYLVSSLPRKGDFWDKFIRSLRNPDSLIGTSHGEVADKLEEEKQKIEAERQRQQQLQQDRRMDEETGDNKQILLTHNESQPIDETIGGRPTDREGSPDNNANADFAIGDGPIGKSPARGKWRKYFSLRFIVVICVVCALLASVTVAALVLMGVLPNFRTSHVYPSTGRTGNMMEMTFGIANMWITSATLSLSNCDGSLYVINEQSCSDLHANYSQVVPVFNAYDYTHWFMLPGSLIEYALVPAGSIYVWIFTEFTKYSDNVDRLMNNELACDQYPQFCRHLYNPTQSMAIKTIPLEEAASYFVYVENSRDANMTVYRRQYDPQKVAKAFMSTSFLSTQLTAFSFRNSFGVFRDTCVLVSVDECYFMDTLSGVSSLWGVYEVHVARRRDLLYLGVIIVIPLIVLVLLFTCICHTCITAKSSSYNIH